jgi:S1-C subfamily serine protease
VGDVVLAFGNPLGVGQTVTMGIVSAKGRATGVGDGSYEDFLQTDAPINHGNSGGALVNLAGQLVGINTQIVSPSGGNIGLGFAIPSSMARAVADQLIESGTVHRSKLGVTVQGVTPELAESLGMPSARGALVSGVEPGSPAARAGLRQRDVVVGLDGEKLADSNSLRNRIAGMKPGSRVALEVIRDGRAQTLSATLDTLKSESAERTSRGEGAESQSFGMSVAPLTPELASQLGLSTRQEGVVVRSVDPDGAAAAAGLRANDVIAEVNGNTVKSPGELKDVLSKTGERPALLLVTRGNNDLFLTLKRLS